MIIIIIFASEAEHTPSAQLHTRHAPPPKKIAGRKIAGSFRITPACFRMAGYGQSQTINPKHRTVQLTEWLVVFVNVPNQVSYRNTVCHVLFGIL